MEYADHVSQSVIVKFPVVDQPNMFVLIWTTTPWTLPANLAVAFNSQFSYSLVQVGEEAYILSTLLLDKVAEQCGWESFQIIRSLDGEEVGQLSYRHPFAIGQGSYLRVTTSLRTPRVPDLCTLLRDMVRTTTY